MFVDLDDGHYRTAGSQGSAPAVDSLGHGIKGTAAPDTGSSGEGGVMFGSKRADSTPHKVIQEKGLKTQRQGRGGGRIGK